LYGASELQMGGAIANPDDMIWWYDTGLQITCFYSLRQVFYGDYCTD